MLVSQPPSHFDRSRPQNQENAIEIMITELFTLKIRYC